ncbi:MAG: response regulator [Melioribacteraceae bacterium]|nr:response regulator [Melioribacteraceae bacterium]MCF8263708.1 response regulator [Melioribacteraceae bacterium]MCF8413567.1 response regulator [Melioribacteraceae bacterium]
MAANQKKTGKTYKILIVDDQSSNVLFLEKKLIRSGYSTITAFDGNTALELARSEKPDLILLDIMMPGLSGYEVCEKLVASNETKNIPIILVTALISSSDLEKGLNAGAYDYIKKPFDNVELLARINSALRFSEYNKLMREAEKINTYAATVVTTNHELKQPLTLINLSISAIRRETTKENVSTDSILKRAEIIENATDQIIQLMDKLTSIKKPEIKDYVNDLKIINLSDQIERKGNY